MLLISNIVIFIFAVNEYRANKRLRLGLRMLKMFVKEGVLQ
jgi:hypothetical protein